MRLNHVKVNTVADYFLLPKQKREWYGFYRRPYALEWNFVTEEKGWLAFERAIRTHYPIQWFFREWMFSLSNPVYSVFVNLKHNYWNVKSCVKSLLSPVFPRWRKTIPLCGYADGVYLIVESNFNIILDFYYSEAINGYVDWESDEAHRKFYNELKENVKWIQVERNAHMKKGEDILSITYKDENEHNVMEKYKLYDTIEKEIYEKESSIIKWMVDHRRYFWT